MIYKLQDIVQKKDGLLRGPFGSALKKSLFVPKGENTYKVYEQSVPLQQDESLGRYYITKEYYDSGMSRFGVGPGDFIVSCSGVNYGAIIQLSKHAEQGVINQALLRIRLDNDIVDNSYFLYLFRGLIVRKITSGTGDSTIPNFPPMELVRNIEFDLPSLEEQRLIGNVLSLVDEKIFNNDAICSNLEGMAKLLYDYWFVQFDFPDENGKPYKSSGGKMVWNDELKREIPVGWEVKPLGDIITESSKSTVQVNGAKADGSYPFFTSGSAILAYDQFFVDGFHCFLNTGGNPDIKGYKGKCAYSTDTWCIDAGKFSYFMYQYFMLIMPQFEQLFFAGSGLKHLQKDALKKQCVALPSDEVIGEFNVLLDDLWDKRTACFLENQQLASLRDFLLPMLMNGQVKVGA